MLETLSLPSSPLQQLAQLQEQIEDLDTQIAEAEETYGIRRLRETREKKQAAFLAELERIVPTLQFSEDRFLKSLKKRGDSFKDGAWKLVRTSRTTRTVLMDKFADAFPDLLRKVAKIELTKADALVGKKTMESYVDKKISYSYELVDLRK